MLEKILPFVIALFVLSQVSERISNFLKLYLPAKIFGNLDVKEKFPAKEKIRERKILALSLVAGLITTFLFFKAYVIPAQHDSKQPEWVCYLYEKRIAAVPLFAFFLSFGSKFWHDLLDILFLYKNAQRVLKSGEAMQASSPEEISQMMAISSVQIARRVLADKKKELMATQGVVAVGIGTTEDEEPTLRVYYVEGSAGANLPNEIQWEDGSGFVRTIRIEKIVSSRVSAQAARVGGKIANENAKDKYGTMGFVFQDKFDLTTFFASTCYHVVKMAGHDWNIYSSFPPDVICHLQADSNCSEKTMLRKGGRSDILDVAFAKLESLEKVAVDSLPLVKASALINQDYAGVPVSILANGEKKAGYIHDWKTEVEVHYSDGSSKTFMDFFSIRLGKSAKAEDLKSVTVGGDSGSAVLIGNTALGMVVGSSDKLTYAMKIKTIEDNYGVSLYPHPTL